MATKNISLMEDAYFLLASNKSKDESFSDVVRRILSRKRSVMEFAGAWKNIGKKDIKEMKKEIEKLRKNSTKSLIKRPN